jgi:hypothetical protein
MPAAAVPATAAALPRDRMTFVGSDDSGKNDRVLVYAMVGILVLTGLAFGVNHFAKKDDPTPPAPPAVSSPQESAPAAATDQSPKPAVVPLSEYSPPRYQPQPPPVEIAPVQETPAVVQSPARTDQSLERNRKMNIMRDIIDEK